MSPGYTYYDVFRLDEHATPQQIRTAYLDLMKVHHPDRSTAEQSPGFVALINLCYETLSDPTKRAAYDAELRQRNNLAGAAALGAVTMRARKQFLPTRLGLMFLLAGCAAGLIGLASSRSLELFQAPTFFQQGQSASAEPSSLSRLTQHDLIEREVRLAKTLSPTEAMLFSERCFRRAQAERGGGALQLCIIFDDAFLYWRQTPQWNALLPSYFDDEVVHSRHSASLLRFETNVEGTLAQLRYEAFRALLDDVDSPETPAADPT